MAHEHFFYDVAAYPGVFRTDAPVVAVTGFGSGYHPVYTRLTAADLNSWAALNQNRAGTTPAEILEAALTGSAFGWNVPGAQPAVDYILALRERAAKGGDA